MAENQFSFGDLVAHKAYPEQALGRIIKFHDSGRLGVSGDRARSFLPKNLVLVMEVEAVVDAMGTCEVMEVPPVEVEELRDAIATSEVMEVPPLEVEELGDARGTNETDEFENGCPECGSHKLEATPLGVEWQTNPDYYLVLCSNCAQWWFPDKVPVPLMPDAIAQPTESIATQSSVIELPPIPRDFSKLDELPEWWEKPVMPETFKCEEDDDDGESWWELVEPGYFKAKYRSWELLIDDGYQIYATPPSGDRLYRCECELDLDGPSGQVAIAQEFIDSWYFAQPSPGQLSLNIPETVARDPPPRFR